MTTSLLKVCVCECVCECMCVCVYVCVFMGSPDVLVCVE